MKVYLKYLWLSLLSAIFTVSLGIGQNSYAYTWQNINEWLTETYTNIQLNQQPYTENLTAFNNIYDRLITRNFFNQTITGIDINNKYIVFYSDSYNWWHIYTMTQNPTITIDTNNILYFTNFGQQVDYRFHYENNQLIKDTFTSNINNNKLNITYTLFFNIDNINTDWEKINGDNLYTWNENIYKEDIQIIGESILVNDNQFYTQFRKGYTWDISSNGFDFKLYYMLNNNKIYLDNYTTKTIESDNENGYIVKYDYNDKIPLMTPLYNELYYKNKYVSTSPYYMLNFKNTTPSGDNGGTSTEGLGNITTPSGDNNGNINLIPIVNAIDENTEKVIKTIESGNQLLEEQNQIIQENNDFWKETYKALFTLNSGDIDDLYEHIQTEMAKLSGDSNMAEEMEILEKIRDTEPRRFYNNLGGNRI